MADDQSILGGTGTDVFLGIAVSDFATALDWYQRLFGAKPSFYPNDTEAVWSIGERRWIYIILDTKRAGGAVQTIMSDDLERVIDEIGVRGLNFDSEENPAEGVRKVMYHDPDGNEIGLGRIPG